MRELGAGTFRSPRGTFPKCPEWLVLLACITGVSVPAARPNGLLPTRIGSSRMPFFLGGRRPGTAAPPMGGGGAVVSVVYVRARRLEFRFQAGERYLRHLTCLLTFQGVRTVREDHGGVVAGARWERHTFRSFRVAKTVLPRNVGATASLRRRKLRPACNFRIAHCHDVVGVCVWFQRRVNASISPPVSARRRALYHGFLQSRRRNRVLSILRNVRRKLRVGNVDQAVLRSRRLEVANGTLGDDQDGVRFHIQQRVMRRSEWQRLEGRILVGFNRFELSQDGMMEKDKGCN